MAFLEEKDNHSHWEQIWAKKTGNDTFVVCCIPFFTYGLNLGDEVECDANHQIKEVVRSSGNLTYRIWFKEVSDHEIKTRIEAEAKEVGGEHEWSSENLLAASVPFEKRLTFEQILSGMAGNGLVFESGSQHET
jgi:hypothetical protein